MFEIGPARVRKRFTKGLTLRAYLTILKAQLFMKLTWWIAASNSTIRNYKINQMF